MHRRWLRRLVLASSLSILMAAMVPVPPSAAASPASGLPRVVAVTTSGSHSCLLGDDGTVWCWGWALYGQLGIGPVDEEWIHVPQRVAFQERIRQVVAFGESTCALTEGGSVWCWGSNREGELGDGTTENRFDPVPVLGLESGVARLADDGGMGNICAVRVEGVGVCWGSNYAGQLGDGTSDDRVSPVQVTVTSERLTRIVATSGTTCALTDEGAVRCWGLLWSGGESGAEPGTPDDALAITPRGLGSGVAALSASGDIACALMETGAVSCWSWKIFGSVSDVETAAMPWNPGPAPEAVPGVPTGVDAIVTNSAIWEDPERPEGGIHVAWACALRDGDAWCWGGNDAGQLGDGTMIDRASPTEAATHDIAQLASGPGSSLAVLRDGSLLMWGDYDPTPRSPFASPAPAPSGYREPDTLVPAITTHIPTPGDISTDPPVVGANLLLAALAMIAFTIATELLNRSLGQIEPFLAKRFRPIRALDRARARLDAAAIERFGGAAHARRAVALRILGIALFYGIVFALLDPTWNPLTVTGLWLVLIMAVAFGLVGLSGDISSWAVARRWGVATELAVKPGSLLAAIGSTLFSRVLVLVPGIMIGSPEALDIDEDRVDRRRLGRIAGVGLGTVLAVGLGAWLLTMATTALRGNGTTLDMALGGFEAFLLLVFAAAVQNGFVQLLSLRESAGLALRRTHRLTWMLALLAVTFAFWHTLVNPRGDLAEALGATNVQAFVATVAVVLGLAVVAWAATSAARRPNVTVPADVATAPPLDDLLSAPASPAAQVGSPAVATGPAGPSTQPFVAQPAPTATAVLPLTNPAAAVVVNPPPVAAPAALAAAPVVSPTPAPRFCTRCGTQRGEGARFCRSCGLDLLDPQAVLAPIPAPVASPEPAVPPASRAQPAGVGIGRRILGALALVVLVFVVVIAVYVVLSERGLLGRTEPDLRAIESRAAICTSAAAGSAAYRDYSTSTNPRTVDELALEQINREYNAGLVVISARLVAEDLAGAPESLDEDVRAEAARVGALVPADVSEDAEIDSLGKAIDRLAAACAAQP